MSTPEELVHAVYSHENYHLALLGCLSKTAYTSVQALFDDVRALVLDRHRAMLGEETLFLSQRAEVLTCARTSCIKQRWKGVERVCMCVCRFPLVHFRTARARRWPPGSSRRGSKRKSKTRATTRCTRCCRRSIRLSCACECVTRIRKTATPARPLPAQAAR